MRLAMEMRRSRKFLSFEITTIKKPSNCVNNGSLLFYQAIFHIFSAKFNSHQAGGDVREILRFERKTRSSYQ